MRVGRRRDREAGFSLLEAIVASFVGLMALAGILYLYKSQHRGLTLQTSVADMRMNGQYALNELQYYLAHAGLGLPHTLPNLFLSRGDLVLRINWSRRETQGSLEPGGGSDPGVYRIPAADTLLFSDKAYAVVQRGLQAQETEILGVERVPGNPALARLRLAAARSALPASGRVYPCERIRLRREESGEAALRGGEFRVLHDNPSRRPGLDMDSLVLAEGIEAISFKWLTFGRDTLAAPPANLDSLRQIEIVVATRSLVANRHKAGDGYARDTLTARTAYRRAW